MKVDILGTEYTILADVDEKEMPESADGVMDQSIRTIKIAKLEVDRNTLQSMEPYRNKVIRHEIVHAFLYESGLWSSSACVQTWAQSEEITDWIAIQLPKIIEACKAVGAL